MLLKPDEFVTQIMRDLGITNEVIEKIRSGHETWPRWSFAPSSRWVPYVPKQRSKWGEDGSWTAAVASTIVPWRYSRSIYRFDSDLYKALVSTPLANEIPEEVLLRLPEWSVYIEMQQETIPEQEIHGIHYPGTSVQGFFASLTPTGYGLMLNVLFCDDTFSPPLLICLATKGNKLYPKGTVKEAMDGQFFPEFRAVFQSVVERAVTLVLYLCSSEAEIRDRDVPDWAPSFPRPKILKGRERLFPADRLRMVEVGSEIGSMLREAKRSNPPSMPTGRTVRSHLRRGHWHGYWTGPRKENINQQKFIFKWLPPIVVHGRDC